MRYNELIENTELPDDDLFGKSRIDRVNMSSIEIDNVDRRDAPDYADAYISYAEFDNGTELDNDQLDWLTDELSNSGKLHELIYNKLYEGTESDDDLFGADTLREMSVNIAQCVEWLAEKIEDEEIEVRNPQQAVAELTQVQQAFEFKPLRAALQSLDLITDANVLEYLDMDMYEHFQLSLGDIEEKYLGVDESTDKDLFGDWGVSGSPEQLMDLYHELEDLCDQGLTGWDVDELLLRSSEAWNKIYSRVDHERDPRVIVAEATAAERSQIRKDILDLLREVKQEHGLDESEDDMFGERNIIKDIQRLLKAKQPVYSRILGAMGIIYDARDDGTIGLKPKPHSTRRFSWSPDERLADFYLKNNEATGRWELRSKQQDAEFAKG